MTYSTLNRSWRIVMPLFLAGMCFVLSACGGSSSDSATNRLIGTWIVDRILGDPDGDADDSTLIYNSDGTAEIYAEGDILDATWEEKDGMILTTLPDFGVTLSSDYALENDDDVLTTMTVSDGNTITEYYYRLMSNYPEELVGTWTPVSKTVHGADVSVEDEAELVLNDDGTGSFTWGVTLDRLLLLNATTLQGRAWEYTITEADGVKTLVISETDDPGTTIITYTM